MAGVLIAGAGPVGLVMALELTRYGVRVRRIEKIRERARTSRAVAVWSRTMEPLDRSGVTADLLPRGNRVTAANIHAGGGRVTHIGFNDIPSPYPFALMIPQYETEAVLVRHLGPFGVEAELGTELMGGDRFRVIVSLGPSTGDAPQVLTLAEFQRILDRRAPGGITLVEAIWTRSFRINARQVETCRSGRVFLAGDAAHVHGPAGGQGMSTGMQDAFNLAWKLALACRGEARAPVLLDSYDPERKPVGAQVIRTAGRLTKMVTIHDPTLRHLRNLVAQIILGLAPVQRSLGLSMTEISVGYAASPLNGRPLSAPGRDDRPTRADGRPSDPGAAGRLSRHGGSRRDRESRGGLSPSVRAIRRHAARLTRRDVGLRTVMQRVAGEAGRRRHAEMHAALSGAAAGAMQATLRVPGQGIIAGKFQLGSA